MKPISPVLPDLKATEVLFAKDQPQYTPLPAYMALDDMGHVITRWNLDWRERLAVLFGGYVWLTVLTFGRPLQPVMLDTACPVRSVGRDSSGRRFTEWLDMSMAYEVDRDPGVPVDGDL